MTRRYKAPSFDAPGRLFQIMRAARMHTQLWLQADRPSTSEYRLEVLFPAVQYVCMPFVLRGLHLRRADPQERGRLSELHGLDIDPELDMHLLSREHDWFVVSDIPQWAEANLAYDDDPVFYTPRYGPDVVISLGTLE